jgi:hypothetical protein
MPWRVEPEIPEQRHDLLRQRLSIQSDVERGQYPFKGMRLSRADVEWLLAEHENGRGPVDWADPDQRCRNGLDLRGADLSGVDLASLPLARSRGGLTPDEYVPISGKQPLTCVGQIYSNLILKDPPSRGLTSKTRALTWLTCRRLI